jgi:pyruvate/2-oxoglutarate dehydrogenase complex dihydrolipoamide dehydrogenase (E3) component
VDDENFDVVVVGAGPAGEVCAGRLAEAGKRVALVESELVGGECSYYACMPSKALLRAGQVLAEAARVPGAAQALSGKLDVRALLERRDQIIHGLKDDDQLTWLRERGIELVRGHGSIVSERVVQADDRRLHARSAVVIATGSCATLPPIPGLAEANPWTNRQASTAEAIPGSLLILGGGAVGVEMASAYVSLGTRVTLIENLPRLIAGEEEQASALVCESLRNLGVEVLLGMRATAVRRAEQDGPITLELADSRLLKADQLLLAVGRTPRTENLGLELLGLEPGEPIEVDERMRTPGHDWLYAVGDVNGRVLLTHMGKYQARLAADQILGRPTALCSDGRLSPRVIFTEPQVAAVGHTLKSAREAGLNVRAVDRPTGANAGASFVGHGTPGAARMVVDEDRRVIVGATFTGVEVAEWLHAATIAVIGEVPIERLWHAVPSFPTRSEVWLGLLEEYGL